MQLTQKSKTALIAFLAFDVFVVAVLIALFMVRGERQSVEELREIGVTIYPEPRAIRNFRLLDQRGEFFSKNDFRGHWNLVFFGFTRCPDICPLTMSELRQFYAGLDFSEDVRPRVFLVTVDPTRDDPESMGDYLADYNEEFIGLSGDPIQIAGLAKDLYVAYEEMTPTEAPSSHQHEDRAMAASSDAIERDYLISHSGHIAVINPEGDYYAVMRTPHRDQDLIKAFRELVR